MLLTAAVLFGQGSEVKNPHTTAADVAAGARIFRSHCAECHGLRGEGDRGPNLTTGVFFHGSTDADLLRNISNGIPGSPMPAIFFSPDQVWQIVAYVRSLSGMGSKDRPPGDSVRGGRIFRDKGCNGCHLVRGEGGIRGPDLSVIGSQRSTGRLRQAILDPAAQIPREYWVAKITMERGEAYSGYLMNEDTHTVQILDFSRGLQSLPKHDFRKFEIDKSPVMPSYKGKVTETELNDLVAYLWSLQRQAGSQ